ncbi:hypothetical protein ACRBEJ_15935 [Yersinia proxima]|uniref:hypothetical protein n=1 Tax=Yersinia proxima TaxID=2890316 RepID=UPI003D690AE8
MAKVTVHAANFPYTEISISWGSIFIKTGAFQLSGECILGNKVATLDIATEDSVKKVGGTIGWGVIGGVLAGPVGILAGALLGGNKKEITFVAELDDGRKFMATTDSKSFTSLKAASMKF